MDDQSQDEQVDRILDELADRGFADSDEAEEILREVLGGRLSASAQELLAELEENRESTFDEREESRSDFEDRLRRRWRIPFELLQQIVDVSEALGTDIYREISSEQEELPATLDALVGLHVRGCRVAREVQCLLQGGFPSGALSRWRTLYELSVVAAFLAEHGDEVAERYLLHSIHMTRKDVRQYKEYCDALGFEPVESSVVERLSAQEDELRERFGSEFLSDYGWAAEALDNPRPGMVDLAASVDLQHLRPFTNLANHMVHAGSKGLTWSIGTPDESLNLHSGATNYGLADPGQLTGHSLTLLTATLVTQSPDVERLVYCHALERLSEKAARAFATVQRRIEEEASTSDADDALS